MTEDITKLPKWAQARIENLERDLERANERFSELGRVVDPHLNPPRGHISYGDWQRDIEIPEHDHVTFHLGGNANIRMRFDDDRGVQVQASDTLELGCQASNTLVLRLEKDRVREKLLEARADARARDILLNPSKFRVGKSSEGRGDGTR